MKRLNAAVRLTCWLVALFAMVFLSQAESRDGRFSTTQQKKPRAYVIHIVDQNGRPAISGVPSGGQIFDVAVGQGGLTFDPNELNISVGDTVRWTWFSNNHSVTSGPDCAVDSQFCSPDDTNCPAGTLSNTGTVYQHTFAEPGTYSYFCFTHCALGMTGVVNVLPAPSGFLYGSTGGDNATGGGRLWLIDVTSQNATLIGDTGFDRLGGIAFDSTGTLYGVSGGATHPRALC
jgi:plastocyanin